MGLAGRGHSENGFLVDSFSTGLGLFTSSLVVPFLPAFGTCVLSDSSWFFARLRVLQRRGGNRRAIDFGKFGLHVEFVSQFHTQIPERTTSR